MHSRRFWQRWEEAGICFGVLLVVINLYAILTPYLSGPLFHPALVVIGIMVVYVCSMMLGGADHDQAATGNAEPA